MRPYSYFDMLTCGGMAHTGTGCIPDSGLSLFSLGVSVVYTHQAGRTPALLHQNWQSSEKSQYLKEKTQYLMNTLYTPRSYM